MDRIGRRITLMVFAALSALTALVYFSGRLPTGFVTAASFPLGFSLAGLYGGLGAFLSELFPTQIRASAQGFSYNCGRIVAASFPPLIGSLSSFYSLPLTISVFVVASSICVIIAAVFLPETKGRSLETI